VLPGLEGEARYQVLMVANAMAIALREIGAGEAARTRELELLDALYGPEEPATDEDAAARVARLSARFARDLRSGELDGGPQLGVRRLLRERIEASLAVSNPKLLARYGARPGPEDECS
jgi:hypothetical protein